MNTKPRNGNVQRYRYTGIIEEVNAYGIKLENYEKWLNLSKYTERGYWDGDPETYHVGEEVTIIADGTRFILSIEDDPNSPPEPPAQPDPAPASSTPPASPPANRATASAVSPTTLRIAAIAASMLVNRRTSPGEFAALASEVAAWVEDQSTPVNEGHR